MSSVVDLREAHRYSAQALRQELRVYLFWLCTRVATFPSIHLRGNNKFPCPDQHHWLPCTRCSTALLKHTMCFVRRGIPVSKPSGLHLVACGYRWPCRSAVFTGLMFDFDLQRSITIDSSGNYIVNPVISAVVTDDFRSGTPRRYARTNRFQRDRCRPS